MDTLIATAFALLIIVPLVWRYWKRSGVQLRPAIGYITCPRCGGRTESHSSLCPHCHTPLAIWGGTGDSGPIGSDPKPVINASLCIGCGACVDVCPEKGSLALISGKAILVNPDLCKAHGDCVKACPTNGIVLLKGGAKQTIRVPLTNYDFETNVPGLFIVGELGGLGLIKTAINEGRRVADTIRLRLDAHRDRKKGRERYYDVIIVGAGPAGLSSALSLQSYGVDYLILEQGEIAATIRNYPRKKFLMEEPLEVPLVGRLRMRDTTKEALLEVWDEIVQKMGVRIRTNHRVLLVHYSTEEDCFKVGTSAGEFLAACVVLATGKRGSPRKLNVPGEVLDKVSYRLIEAETYENCDVAVAGGGDSAIEAALALARSGRNRVTLIHRGKDFPRLKDRNRTRLYDAEKDGSVKVMREGRIKEIQPANLLVDCPDGCKEIPNEFLFILVGGESPEEFLEKSGVEIIERVLA
jgi:thioredoxin reductase/NAD-dependent dihydropyrimidine dehydrogenase PreA subunit